MRRVFRGIRVFRVFIPFLWAFLRDRRRFLILGGPARRRAGHHEARARALVETIARLGPTFIKLAQILSARPDLFREPYLGALGTLQDQVPAIPAAAIRGVVEEELGLPLEDRFEGFDETPLAAASLGQVHRARYRGEAVVLKVLRPGVAELVELDLDLSFRILFWLNVLFPNPHVEGLTNVIREFAFRVQEEMDFRIEADNMARFRKAYQGQRDARGRGIRIPRVHEEVSTRRLLTMEFVEGTKVDRLEPRFAAGELSFDDVMERLAGLYLRMLLRDGFLHADPHPGNLLVHPSGDLVILDWGMALDVPRPLRDAVLSIALAVERDDLDGMIHGMDRLGMISPQVPRGEIREAAQEIMRILEKARTSSRDRIQEVMEEVWDTLHAWPLRLPQELVYFFRAGALLEGIGFRYDPAFNGLHLFRRVVATHRGELLRETAREPIQFARDLVVEGVQALRAVRDLLTRLEREELRVRIHPRDAQGQERFFHLQARRLLFSIFATTLALISAILFLSLGNPYLLVAGLLGALLLFFIALLIPTHLLENPLRYARLGQGASRRRPGSG
jgi:predicted unusual protein kinase regulating ubiquinone biosynthesis (AarF/ABC1/UbiB family)